MMEFEHKPDIVESIIWGAVTLGVCGAFGAFLLCLMGVIP